MLVPNADPYPHEKASEAFQGAFGNSPEPLPVVSETEICLPGAVTTCEYNRFWETDSDISVSMHAAVVGGDTG